jgi:hypothetical protein
MWRCVVVVRGAARRCEALRCVVDACVRACVRADAWRDTAHAAQCRTRITV